MEFVNACAVTLKPADLRRERAKTESGISWSFGPMVILWVTLLVGLL